MNENIDLTKILKNCPKGTKFYSTIFGEVEFLGFYEDEGYAITIKRNFDIAHITKDGRYLSSFNGECTLFPSKDQRDWSKFTAPWYKKEKFDPKTLKPFDKILVRPHSTGQWRCSFFSHYRLNSDRLELITAYCTYYDFCIPYNDDTKHLVGTNKKAPEYYKYWED